MNGLLNVLKDFEAIKCFGACGQKEKKRRPSGSLSSRGEVFEWIGDAVLEELVGRVLLAQFQNRQVPPRMFRNFRFSIVTNTSLAQVFDRLGFRTFCFATKRKPQTFSTKAKGDIMEAVIGELYFRLLKSKESDKSLKKLHCTLDLILSDLFNVEFLKWKRAFQETNKATCNQFSLLELLQSDDTQRKECFEDLSFASESDDEDRDFDCSVAELIKEKEIEEYDYEKYQSEFLGCLCLGKSEYVGERSDISADDFRFKVDSLGENSDDPPRGRLLDYDINGDKVADDSRVVEDIEAGDTCIVSTPFESFQASFEKRKSLAFTDCNYFIGFSVDLFNFLKDIGCNHVLRTSSDIFEIFMIYGTSVISERVSNSLAYDFLSRSSATFEQFTPSMLTFKRQKILSKENLSKCAKILEIVQAIDEAEYAENTVIYRQLEANTLRAIVGFASAFSHQSIVNGICCILSYFGCEMDNDCSCAAVFETNVDDISQWRHQQNCTLSIESFCKNDWKISVKEATSLENLLSTMHASKKLLFHKDFAKQFFVLNSSTKEMIPIPMKWSTLSDHSVKRTLNTPGYKHINRKKIKLDNENVGVQWISKKDRQLLDRFSDILFFNILENIIVKFAQRDFESSNLILSKYERDLGTCISDFRSCEAKKDSLILVLQDKFYRLLVHAICGYHRLESKSSTCQSGQRITCITFKESYNWEKACGKMYSNNEKLLSI